MDADTREKLRKYALLMAINERIARLYWSGAWCADPWRMFEPVERRQ